VFSSSAIASEITLTEAAFYMGGFLHLFRSKISCWFAKVRHAASIRIKASFLSSSSALSARKAQSAALSRKVSAKLISAKWSGKVLVQRNISMKCL
jgi:hypothetical protein